LGMRRGAPGRSRTLSLTTLLPERCRFCGLRTVPVWLGTPCSKSDLELNIFDLFLYRTGYLEAGGGGHVLHLLTLLEDLPHGALLRLALQGRGEERGERD
jgi:hypothetical protein